MRFQIQRASDWVFQTHQPCSGAELEQYSIAFSDGAVEAINRWWIEVPSLEELLRLVKEEGNVIVGVYHDTPTIKIYDDHVEQRGEPFIGERTTSK